MATSIVYEKSFYFARSILKLVSRLQKRKEFVLSKQLLRSGTSIGANLAEASHAASRKDFLNKNRIALKEAMETKYWLELLEVDGQFVESIDEELKQVEEIAKLLSAIVITLSQKT